MKSTLFEIIADDYSLMILNWAIKKTGSRADGEDLAQEVLYQVLSFLKDKDEIEKLDNLIWKIAHYTWCNRLRGLKKYNGSVSIDCPTGLYIVEEQDYIEEFVESEALKDDFAFLRRRISELSKVQREIIIAYYLENMSVNNIAEKFNITKSAVKWHLFDARNKIKEKFEESCGMNNNFNMVKPGKLFLGTNGTLGPDPDTKRVNESLSRQNICLLCYDAKGKSIEELTEMMGIPKPYLEYDLDWLVDREFLVLENKRYITNFGILDRQHYKDVAEIYINLKDEYYRKIIDYFNSHEQEIRNIGFYGCDFDWNKLLWSLFTLYLRYFSETEPLKTLKKPTEHEMHKDGGCYLITGFNKSDGQLVNINGILTEAISEPEKWTGINGVWCNISSTTSEFRDVPDTSADFIYATYWLGIYIFAGNASSLTKDVSSQKKWKKIIKQLLTNDFLISDMTDEEKELVAIGVKDNIVKKDGDKYIPKFTIFTIEQAKKLYAEFFAPLVELVKPQTLKLVEKFTKINDDVPRKVAHFSKRRTYVDIWDSGIKNFMFAADDGYLYMPEKAEDGTSLTLSYIY